MSLREIRISRGLTQKQVADAIGVRRTLYIEIEKGCCMPNFATFKKLHSFLNMEHKIDIDFKNLVLEECRHAKKTMSTSQNLKNRANTYNYQVRLKKGEFPLFEKNELKKRGFNSHKQFLEWAYKKLEEGEWKKDIIG